MFFPPEVENNTKNQDKSDERVLPVAFGIG